MSLGEHDSRHPANLGQRRVWSLASALSCIALIGPLGSLGDAAPGKSPDVTTDTNSVAKTEATDVTSACATTGPGVWSTYRGDNARSGYLDIALPPDLQLLWRHEPTQSPRPAWPPPARGSLWQELSRIAPRVVDDHTFHPVAAGAWVLFGSSADDSVYCLDIATGELKWRFTTDGPVRYAPTVCDNRVYVGSDDGYVYCVSLDGGHEIWRRPLAPLDRVIPGNERLISAWPVRTGVAVVDGTAFVGAGLYPSQGVYAYALDAWSGAPSWRTKLDYTAHGYLLVSQDRLILPTGRSTPIMLHRSDGRFLTQLPGSPGSYAVITETELLSGPGDDATLQASDVESHESLVSVAAQHICVTPQATYTLAQGELTAVDLPRLMTVARQLKTLQARFEEQAHRLQQLAKPPASALESRAETANAGQSQSEASPAGDSRAVEPNALEIEQAIAQKQQLSESIKTLNAEREACQLWRVATPHLASLAAASNVLVVGGDGAIELRDCVDGRLREVLKLDGRALGIALSDRFLIVSTETGSINCYGPPDALRRAGKSDAEPGSISPGKSSDESIRKSDPAATGNRWTEKIAALTQTHLQPTFGSSQGYALIAGADDPELVEALCQNTELKITVIDDSRALVATLRRQLLSQGVYGRRVSLRWVAPGPLPFADYLANLVVSTRGLLGQAEPRWPEAELRRLLRPQGGIAWLHDQQPVERRGPLVGAGRWSHQYGNTENTAASGDQLVSGELRLQWFGGPGPARMVDRHLRAPAPLAAAGRLFVSGENSVVCVDSYNGTEYWQLDIPNSQRYSMPYDCGYCSVDGDRYAVAVRDAAWLVDARTGEVQQKIPVPQSGGTGQTHWGYLALQQQRLIGSTQQPTASRTAPSREQVDLDYGNGRPLVTGTSLFVIDIPTGSVRWRHNAIVLNPTITVTKDRLYFVASTNEALQPVTDGRMTLSELIADGAEVIALDLASGEIVWRRALAQHMAACRNILYLQATDSLLVLSGSLTRDDDSIYRIAVLDSSSGATRWLAEHGKGERGAFTHGEQVHHPVILGDRLVCEPVIYDLRTGIRSPPDGEADDWRLTRPAHSCGTMSGAGDCLFFRSGNPTVMSLGPDRNGRDRFRSISPSRPGCWINIIPADGLVLIPEASASCVCHYSLQTSMAFQPVARSQGSEP